LCDGQQHSEYRQMFQHSGETLAQPQSQKVACIVQGGGE
jgi:hypothetical protein